MKTIIIFIFAIICLNSCSNKSIESDPKKTTIEEIEKLKSDTTTYKVVVDDEYNVKIYNKQTNLRVYEVVNYDGAVDSLTMLIFILFIFIVFIIYIYNQ